MPIMESSARESEHVEESPLSQAQASVCSTLRRAVRKMQQALEEQICLDALDYEEGDSSDWHTQNRHITNIGEMNDPDLLRMVALEAPNPHLQTAALWHLIHLQQGDDLKTQHVLRELAGSSDDEQLATLASQLYESVTWWDAPNTASNEATSSFWDHRSTQKSILNPNLPALCTSGVVDPCDMEDRRLIECLVHAQGHDELRYLLPEDRLDERIERWWRNDGIAHLLVHEYDVDALEDYVLYGSDDETRVLAFSRLTGFWHWEKCDAFSHITYSCTPLESYDDARAVRLCEQILATTEPYAPWNDPTPPLDALREGARQVAEHVLYGRVFYSQLTYVGECARAAASQLGQPEGVEHWLLGCLQFCCLSEEDLHNGDFPYIDYYDTIEDIKRSRQLLNTRNIDANRMAHSLWHILATDTAPTSEDLLNYFDVVQRATRHNEAWEITVEALLSLILRYPTEPICRAMNHLALLSALEHVNSKKALDTTTSTRVRIHVGTKRTESAEIKIPPDWKFTWEQNQ